MADEIDMEAHAEAPGPADVPTAGPLPEAPPAPEHPSVQVDRPKPSGRTKVFELDEHTRVKLEPIFADGQQYGWQMSSRELAALRPLPEDFVRDEHGDLTHEGLPVNVYAS